MKKTLQVRQFGSIILLLVCSSLMHSSAHYSHLIFDNLEKFENLEFPSEQKNMTIKFAHTWDDYMGCSGNSHAPDNCQPHQSMVYHSNWDGILPIISNPIGDTLWPEILIPYQINITKFEFTRPELNESVGLIIGFKEDFFQEFSGTNDDGSEYIETSRYLSEFRNKTIFNDTLVDMKNYEQTGFLKNSLAEAIGINDTHSVYIPSYNKV